MWFLNWLGLDLHLTRRPSIFILGGTNATIIFYGTTTILHKNNLKCFTKQIVSQSFLGIAESLAKDESICWNFIFMASGNLTCIAIVAIITCVREARSSKL